MLWVNRYINIPYLNKGRGFEGADCWGLVRLVYEHELGIQLPSYGEVSSDNLVAAQNKVHTVASQAQWINVAPEHIAPFDVCVMRAYGKRLVCHVGVVIDKNTILHVESRSNSVIVSLKDPLIRERITCFRRHTLNK